MSYIVDDPAAWQEVFRDTSELSGSLPSGATPAFDATGPIVASNVIDSGWIDVTAYKDQFFNVIADIAGIKVFLMNATDTLGNNSATGSFTFPNLTTLAGAPATLGAPFFSNFFRVVIINDTGSTSNSWGFRSMGASTPPGSVYQSLDQPIFDFFPAPLVKSVTFGRQPDGDYVATPTDGNLFTTTDTLGAAASYTSSTFDTDGFKAVELYIATDQVSATEGIQVEFTPDTSAPSPTYYPGPNFTFGANEVVEGFIIKRFSPAMDGFRLTYTNGGTPQGSFILDCTVRTAQTENPSISVENIVDPTQANVATRGSLYAKNDTGTYGNILRGDLGGLRTSITEYEIQVPISPLTAFETNGTTVSTSAVQIASGLNANTKTISIKADPANTKVIHIGNSAAVTTANGYPLAAGDSVELEVNESTAIWCISSSGSQTVFWMGVNTHEDGAAL